MCIVQHAPIIIYVRYVRRGPNCSFHLRKLTFLATLIDQIDSGRLSKAILRQLLRWFVCAWHTQRNSQLFHRQLHCIILFGETVPPLKELAWDEFAQMVVESKMICDHTVRWSSSRLNVNQFAYRQDSTRPARTLASDGHYYPVSHENALNIWWWIRKRKCCQLMSDNTLIGQTMIFYGSRVSTITEEFFPLTVYQKLFI